ncbi:hypothetical protein FHX49_001810 [Microbacterium endophyticum]|uniref:DUF2993 domain-containing protein n=1 Tax=Microbacterium endophyticum TaxID=1526412 RepID=A0A7W4V3N8_9MICO|nr:LmeA family phospholipid-binding protein [Microbacterium endophyticum]MBB2976236.1 hypothetical protein [Microbacterium endophyticum]NIK35116.1 hypothetical protein [Microbacterium endophyticum]
MTGETQPTLPLPGEWQDAAAAPRRRRVWPWVLGVVIVIGLIIAAWFVGEAVARDLVTKSIRQTVIAELSLPADQRVNVELEGMILPQLIAGSLTSVHIDSDDVTVGPATGDVSVDLLDIPIRGEGDIGGGSGTVTFSEDQLRALMATVDGFPAESLGLDDPDVTISTDFSFFGASFDIGVALTPSAADGELVLTPSSLQLGGAEITAGDLQSRFGSLTDGVLQDWRVCVAQYIPAAITLTDVSVDHADVLASFDIDPRVATDPAMQEAGTCS